MFSHCDIRTRVKVVALMVLVAALVAQVKGRESDTVELRGHWTWGYEYCYRHSEFKRVPGIIKRRGDLGDILSANKVASKHYRESRTNSLVGGVFLGVGAVVVAAGAAATRQFDSRLITAIGIAAVPVGIGFFLDARGGKLLRLSVRIFNQDLQKKDSARNVGQT